MSRAYRVFSILALSVVVVGSAQAGPPQAGEGCFNFGTSLVPSPNNDGRLVYLEGTITGLNFEPGVCVPIVAPNSIVDGKCFLFAKRAPVGPGEFLREHPGQTAFTYCQNCVIDDREGDFVLKISYPNPKNVLFTKFTIQGGTRDLTDLRGEGTLDFTTGCYTLKYHLEPGR